MDLNHYWIYLSSIMDSKGWVLNNLAKELEMIQLYICQSNYIQPKFTQIA